MRVFNFSVVACHDEKLFDFGLPPDPLPTWVDRIHLLCYIPLSANRPWVSSLDHRDSPDPLRKRRLQCCNKVSNHSSPKTFQFLSRQFFFYHLTYNARNIFITIFDGTKELT